MPEPETKAERPKPDPKALTPEYHKARKQLMLWAGILFVWELVGIDLGKVEATGGNVGAVITAIKSPQAIPWVLLILVLYFLFKTTIEWHQCHIARRTLRVSKIDFYAAWIVAVSAYALYLGQRIGRIQIADQIGFPVLWAVLMGMLLPLAIHRLVLLKVDLSGRPLFWGRVIITAILLMGVSVYAFNFVSIPTARKSMMWGIVVPIFPLSFLLLLLWRAQQRALQR